MDDVKLALSEVASNLQTIVIGPPATSLPAVRALYQLTLVRQMLDGAITYRQFQARISEWDKKNKRG